MRKIGKDFDARVAEVRYLFNRVLNREVHVGVTAKSELHRNLSEQMERVSKDDTSQPF